MTPKKENPAKGGRPKENLYEKHKLSEKLEKIKAWYRDGATDEELAKRLHISISTWHRLKRTFPTLKEALKTSKEEADIQVENALFKRAIGFDFEETHSEMRPDSEGKPKATLVRRVKKHIPADITAAIFWLKNRKPEAWRDKQERELTHSLKDIKINVMSEEAKQMIESGKFFEDDSTGQG